MRLAGNERTYEEVAASAAKYAIENMSSHDWGVFRIDGTSVFCFFDNHRYPKGREDLYRQIHQRVWQMFQEDGIDFLAAACYPLEGPGTEDTVAVLFAGDVGDECHRSVQEIAASVIRSFGTIT